MRLKIVIDLEQSGRCEVDHHPSGDHDAPATFATTQTATLGITPGLVRLSVGLEDPEDLIRDI